MGAAGGIVWGGVGGRTGWEEVYFGLVEVCGLFLWLGGGRLGWVEICFLDIFDGWVG